MTLNAILCYSASALINETKETTDGLKVNNESNPSLVT